MEEAEVKDNDLLLPFLESLKKASKDLQNNSFFITHNPLPAMEALLQLQTQQETIFSSYQNLSHLSQLLLTLKTLSQKLKSSNGYGLKTLLRRQITNYRIYQLGLKIEAQVQACMDRECIRNLVKMSQETESGSEDEKLRGLKEFEKRLFMGFDGDFQELVLKSKGFSILESLLCDPTRSMKIREQSALCIIALVKFNRDVFVGLVLMGPTVQSLISMASDRSIRALCSLIRLIKIPLIDEIELEGEIPRIISLYSSEDLSIKAAAMDCICEIAYSARKEVIQVMIGERLVERLVELQRSGNEEEIQPFASCVKRFAVQIEVGEGLSEKERREFKREILNRVKEASVSEAEAASIFAEVLWGSSP